MSFSKSDQKASAVVCVCQIPHLSGVQSESESVWVVSVFAHLSGFEGQALLFVNQSVIVRANAFQFPYLSELEATTFIFGVAQTRRKPLDIFAPEWSKGLQQTLLFFEFMNFDDFTHGIKMNCSISHLSGFEKLFTVELKLVCV